jgi:putative ABC transport system permease protein
VERFIQDLKYSLRMFRQQRAFTLAAVAALALGIGATTAVFSVVNAILLRPFPYPEPDRIVFFMNTSPNGSGRGASPAKFAHWRQQTDVIQDAAAFRNVIVNYTGNQVPEQLNSGNVTEAFFRLWGARTMLGRTFSAEEDRPNGPRVVVLSHGWWTRRFGADRDIIGKTIALSGDPYTVIGVLAPGFDPGEFMTAPEVWTPFAIDPNTADQAHYFTSAARLKPGVTLAQAQAKLKQSAVEYRQKFAQGLGPNAGFSVEPVQNVLVRNSAQLLTVLLAAVSGVLLIACANVANLLLVRSTVRQREMAIRAALGADRGRIVRQLMTESVLLSLMGGALGLTLGLFGIRSLLSINTAGLPRVGDGGSAVALDWRLLGFTAAVSVVTGLVFGVMPALHAARNDLTGPLRDGAGSGGVRNNRLRAALVVLEMALALVLVIGSGLLIRTSLALRAVEPGFDATNVLTMKMSFTEPRFQASAVVDRAIRDGVDRLKTVPGVVSASASCCLPLEGGFGLPFKIVGRPLDNGPFHGGGAWNTISPGYFEVFGIKILRGRSFSDRDDQAAPAVVMINEAMAKQYWQDRNPIGEHLTIGRGGMREFADEPDREIIGVVANSRDGGLNQDPAPTMFIPQAQVPDRVNALNVRIAPMSWVIKTKVSPLTLSAAAQEQLRLATGLAVADIRSMDQIVSRSTSREQFNTLLMTVFALSALALAAIGIYGVMAYAVEQRTREIGVRLALGAEPGAVRRMVVLQGVRLALAGVVIGTGAAFGLSRYMSSMLFGVQARDPLVFVGVPALLAVVAVVAVWVPAGRASKVDPLRALRSS